MNRSPSTRALLLGSLAAGLGSSIPALMVLLGVSTLLSPDGPSWPNLARIAATYVGIGALAGAFIGFPLLALLRFTNSLSTTSTAIAGTVAGLGIALAIYENWAPFVTGIMLGGVVGGVCGAFALRVANAVVLRPNKSLERTREG
jgi:hypothetical protein